AAPQGRARRGRRAHRPVGVARQAGGQPRHPRRVVPDHAAHPGDGRRAPRRAGAGRLVQPERGGPARATAGRIRHRGRMSQNIGRLAVLGAGSWGTAFAKVLADAGRDVTLFARREPLARAMAVCRVNAEYLPGITLPDRVSVTADLDEALDGVDAVVLAIPSQ